MTGPDAARPNFVTHLKCGATGEHLPAERLQTVSAAGKPLLVQYDLSAVGAALNRAELGRRPRDMWRYEELLPISRAEAVSLGENETPLIPLTRLPRALGGGEVLVKDEGRLPTASFKARGLAMAVSMAKRFGIERIAMPTAGNAGAALAAYCRRAGIEAYVFCPEDAPEITVREIAFHGATVYRVNGLINHCGELVRRGSEEMGWFDFSTLKDPYRIEGKKTMGLELVQQLDWEPPDVILYPTGGGTGLIGMWKAFEEMAALGWIGEKRPRMVAVQSIHCGPLVRAYETGAREVPEPWDPVETSIHGVRVPKPLGDTLCMAAIYDSNGFATAIDDAEVEPARRKVADAEGLNLCPEGAACWLAYKQELASGRIAAGERVVIFNSANGLKADMPAMTKRLDRFEEIDFAKL